MLNQDLAAVDRGGLDELIDNLRRSRGDLTIRPSDFSGTTLGARFYPLLYVLTRTHHSRDLAGAGLELEAGLLGRLNRLEVHHVFPKSILYEHGYRLGEVNAIANFCFLTQDANLEISNRQPAEYFAAVQARHPGALESQWIPTDPGLRGLGRYRDFLEVRRQLLAAAANTFLDRLLASPGGAATVPATLSPTLSGCVRTQPAEPVEAEVRALVERYGLAEPSVPAVIAHPDTGAEIGIADAAWLDGLQGGYDEPVVLALDPEPEETESMEAAGYRLFTSVVTLEAFLAQRALTVAGATLG